MLSPRYPRAVEVARVAHDGVVRKGTGIPYLAHVLAVSALVLEHGGDEDQAIAALLHDVAEDAGGEQRLREIAAEFGDDVGAIVGACSDSLTEDPTTKEGWWVRKVRYLDHLSTADERALLVSAADKTHNAEAILADYRTHGEGLWSRFNPAAGRGGQLWYQTEVGRVLAERLNDPSAQILTVRIRGTTETLRSLVEANVGSDQVERDLEQADEKAAAHRSG